LPGTNIALINGLLHVIFERGWQDADFLRARVEGVDAVRERVRDYPMERVASLTGVSAADLERAARMYTEAKAAFLAYGMGITQHATGTANVMAVSNLVLAAGQIGRAGTGINPLRGQNNVQGACDMGALPDVYPGYQDVSDPAAREKFAKAWGTQLPSTPGLTSLGMQKAARDGLLRALIIFGEDPVVTDPDQRQVEHALRALDLLVVCELTLTETAKLADVVLPAASFAEKDGTFTNCERRVQRVRAALPPFAQARTDWQIAGALAERVSDYEGLRWSEPEAIFDEVAALAPIYSAMSYAALERASGLQWPCDAARSEERRVGKECR
jgi:formate dehydrogenase major subunit